MKTLREFTVWIVLIGALACGMRAEEGGWSADLLSQILKADTPKLDTASSESTAAPASTAPTEMVLRTYQLQHLHIGEAGRPQTMLSSLRRLLPPGSDVKPDVPANSLHVLTTPAAHKDFHDIISAIDVPEAKSPLAAPAIPEDLKTMLQKLAETGDQSGKLTAAIGGLKSEVSQQIADIDARQRTQTFRVIAVLVIVGLALISTFVWMLRRRPELASSAKSGDVNSSSPALVLQPEQLTSVLVPAQEKMRNDMLGMLNEVAIKLQAQHNEQQRLVTEQQKQLETARLAMVEQNGVVAEAVKRVDKTAERLAKQQDKVAELVDELQHTVKELDQTKDALSHKEIELEKERAKIAALSILLEEGNLPPPAGGFAIEPMNDSHEGSDPEPSIPTPLPPCTTQEPVAPKVAQRQTAEPARIRFQFLPPDAPEN